MSQKLKNRLLNIGMIVVGLPVAGLYLWKQNALVDWGGLFAVIAGQTVFVLALLAALAGIFGLSRDD